jgi:low affinity Fe/Cu permease
MDLSACFRKLVLNQMSNKSKSMGRTMKVVLYLLAVCVVIGTLIAYEQISLLYVLTTLALVVLLLVVGFARLEDVGRGDEEVG